jgi:hypothetical protein
MANRSEGILRLWKTMLKRMIEMKLRKVGMRLLLPKVYEG